MNLCRGGGGDEAKWKKSAKDSGFIDVECVPWCYKKGLHLYRPI